MTRVAAPDPVGWVVHCASGTEADKGRVIARERDEARHKSRRLESIVPLEICDGRGIEVRARRLSARTHVYWTVSRPTRQHSATRRARMARGSGTNLPQTRTMDSSCRPCRAGLGPARRQATSNLEHIRVETRLRCLHQLLQVGLCCAPVRLGVTRPRSYPLQFRAVPVHLASLVSGEVERRQAILTKLPP